MYSLSDVICSHSIAYILNMFSANISALNVQKNNKILTLNAILKMQRSDDLPGRSYRPCHPSDDLSDRSYRPDLSGTQIGRISLDHILFEIVFEILDFTFSSDEHTSCPTKLRNNFVAGQLQYMSGLI